MQPDWEEVAALLRANFTPCPTVFVEAGALPGGATVTNSAEAFVAAATKLLQPLLRNALAQGQAGTEAGDKFRSVRANHPWVKFGREHVIGAAELLRVGGFALVFDDAQEPRYVLSSATSAATLSASQREVEADRLRTAQALLEQVLAECESTTAGQPPAARQTAAASTVQAVPPPPMVSRARPNDDGRSAELARLKAAIARDREALETERTRQAASVKAAGEGEAADYAAGSLMLDTVKRTLHFTGRLRNSAFEGEGFRARVMRNGRRYACGDAACLADHGGLEVHWHLRSGSLLYGFVAHLNAEGTEVRHVGPELGYQYNALPHTPHFGKTLLGSRVYATVDGKLLKHETLEGTVATECAYCGESFDKLWR
jgi:hypothetical protein